jgi:ABC-type nitrate/sulfonate/bicarbonate transport system substrate-binding protein
MFDDGDLMTSTRSIPFARRSLTLTCVVAFAVAACGPAGSTGSPTPSPSAAASAATGPSTSASGTTAATPSASVAPLGTVRLALDWTPNTNHTGFYVASSKGWYAAAGVDLEILPYGTTTPEALMAAGQAECGISFQDALTFSAAAGAPITSVMAILQHTAQEIAVLASSDITRPRQLDGRTYAGFGYPNEEPTLKAVIKADGGKGTFTTVTLDTAAYDALYAKRADFVITFAAWEGIEAKERGIDLRTFRFGEYGFPDFYQVVLACDSRWLAAHPDLARAFVGATARGFDLAASDPDEGARLLVSANPGVFDGSPDLPLASQRFLATGGYLRDANGMVGRQTLAEWQGYSGFLFDQGLLAGPDGKPLKTAPDYGALFTNAFLP